MVLRCLGVAICAVTTVSEATAALSFELGNVLVANGGRVTEYRTDGTLVGFVNVPRPAGIRRTLGGLVIDPLGRLHVNDLGGDSANSFEHDYLSTFDPRSGQWTSRRMPSSGPDVVSDEDLTIFDGDLYYNSHRVDLNTFEVRTDAPALSSNTAEFVTGHDGKLYSVARPGIGGWNIIRQHQGDTLAVVREWTFGEVGGSQLNIRGLAVNAEGEFYVANWSPGFVYHLDREGQLLRSYDLQLAQPFDLHLSAEGFIAVGGRAGVVDLLDESFASHIRLHQSLAEGAYTAFVPEPACATVLILVGGLIMARTRLNA